MLFDSKFHEPTEYERTLIDRLLAAPFEGRNEIAEQARNIQVRWIAGAGAPALVIRPMEAAQPANVSTRVPVDAIGRDLDGHEIFLLLHIVDGHISEIEVYRGDGAPVQQMPDPATLHVMSY